MVPSLEELSRGPIGRLTTPGGLSLELTSDDALWLARAAVGEGRRDAADIVSTMLRRWSVVSDANRRPMWPSLTALVVGTEENPRGYSQPVSVYWRTRGDTSAQARRLRIRSLGWDEIPDDVRSAVLAVLVGQRGLSMPSAIHFADARVSSARLREGPNWRLVGRGSNWFLSTAASRRAADPVVSPLASLPALEAGARVPFSLPPSSGREC